jgi:hypothetical protein
LLLARSARADAGFTRDLSRSAGFLSVALIGLGGPLLAVVYILMLHAAFTGLAMHDYGLEYHGLQRWLQGGSPYSRTGASNLVPPFIHLLYLPFVALPPLTSYVVWQGLNLGLVIWVWWTVAAEHDWIASVRRRTVGALLILASGPVTTGAYTGQPIGFLALIGWATWTAARQRKWTRAGVLLAILVVWKPTFAVLAIILVLTRRWTAVATSAIAGLAATTIGALLFGYDGYREWLESIRALRAYPSRMNLSVYGFVSRIFEGGMNLAPAVYMPAVVAPIVLLVSAALAWRVWLRLRAVQQDPDWVFALGIVAASLLFPIGWSYYLPAAIGPLCAVFAREPRLWKRSDIFIACWLVPFSLLWLGQPSALASVTIGSIYFWGTIGLMWQITAPAR